MRAVGEQVGESGRENHRFLLGSVIGRTEIDGILVDAVEEETRDFGEARFGVAHGRRVIAVDISEIALPVDQRIALGEFLSEANQRVVHGLVAVRVELADDVADHAGAFLERGAGVEPQLAHGIDQPAMHRLEAVARIGKRPVHDGGECVGEIALFQRIAQRNLLDLISLGRGNQLFAHGGCVSPLRHLNKG